MVYWVYHICKNGILAATNINKLKHQKTISARFGFCSSVCKARNHSARHSRVARLGLVPAMIPILHRFWAVLLASCFKLAWTGSKIWNSIKFLNLPSLTHFELRIQWFWSPNVRAFVNSAFTACFTFCGRLSLPDPTRPWSRSPSCLPSGKPTACYGKSPLSMGKSTINEPFSIAVLVYRRGNCPLENTQHHFPPKKWWWSEGKTHPLQKTRWWFECKKRPHTKTTMMIWKDKHHLQKNILMQTTLCCTEKTSAKKDDGLKRNNILCNKHGDGLGFQNIPNISCWLEDLCSPGSHCCRHSWLVDFYFGLATVLRCGWLKTGICVHICIIIVSTHTLTRIYQCIYTVHWRILYTA